MRINNLKPAAGSRPKAIRLGRGIGSTYGKTCGKGHKGQKARSGGYHKVGFEGGQMPIQRRLPKTGFRSAQKKLKAAVTLAQLNRLDVDVIDLALLKSAGLVSALVEAAKVITKGVVTKPLILKGMAASESARGAIVAAGGRFED